MSKGTSDKMPKAKSKQLPVAKTGDCEHHWIIEAPNGPTSAGECRVCGETREFANYLESSAWSGGGVTLQQLSDADQRGGSTGTRTGPGRGRRSGPSTKAGGGSGA